MGQQAMETGHAYVINAFHRGSEGFRGNGSFLRHRQVGSTRCYNRNGAMDAWGRGARLQAGDQHNARYFPVFRLRIRLQNCLRGGRVGTCRQYLGRPFAKSAHYCEDVLHALSRAINDLREPCAQRPMMVQFGETKVLEGKVSEPL
jgi:hypothetical protein